MKNWRPISLLCVDYKIIAKALAKKLQSALPEIIHPNQTCGIPNRSINNNLWTIRDTIHHATENYCPTLLISLDQEKAFDRVDHAFGIAATLSRDPTMMMAYRSGDPYMTFAIQAGAAPEGATKNPLPISNSMPPCPTSTGATMTMPLARRSRRRLARTADVGS